MGLFNAGAIPAAFSMIVEYAFTPLAAQGGFAGAILALLSPVVFKLTRDYFNDSRS